jgi:uncharacterized protein YacL
MKELEPLINQAVDLIKGSKEFVLSQAPDFIRQFVIYSYLSTLGWLVFSSICLAFVVKCAFYLRKNWDEIDDVGCVFGTTGVIVGGFLAVLAAVSNLNDLALIHFAPKVYIVTHLASCLKGQ